MASAPLSTEEPHNGMPRSRRWIALLVASILLHLFAYNWADGRIGLPSWREPDRTVITVALKTAEPAALPSPAPSPPKTRAKPRHAAVAQQPAPVAVADAAPSLPPEGIEVPGTSVESATEIASVEPATDSQSGEPAAPAAKPQEQAAHYKVDPPPSAELKYDVLALREGQTVYGHGKISWRTEGNSYTITGEAGILFFTVLNFRSEGVIDGFGVAPVMYSEKRFRRSETNTHFHRERNTISFSASTVSYPRKGGEQDRASIIWQLAGIGRGDSEKFVPDTDIDIFVAGMRDAETWHIRVIGEEVIELDSGKVTAWHLVRMPRPGSYDQKLDIWLAPQQQWYPVKLRYTETNGDYLDMSLSNLNPVTAR
jgi:hypothetical protein